MAHPSRLIVLIFVALAGFADGTRASAQELHALVLRGQRQQLHLSGPRTGNPVIVSSGDGGWIHLGPQVADFLSQRGFFVVGFDVKGYLEAFTSRTGTLRPADVPGDYRLLAEFATQVTGKKPILIGVSEGAGLSVLAAADLQTKAAIGGVIGLGLPDVNELGWRWKDSLSYLTHTTPAEPTFSAAAVAASVAPLPLAAIHSSHDEFVPIVEVQRVLANAREPKRLWMIEASNHRFSDNRPELEQRLLEAIGWIGSAMSR